MVHSGRARRLLGLPGSLYMPVYCIFWLCTATNMRRYSPAQPGYAADRFSLLVVKHADIKSKLWKPPQWFLYLQYCFTTTGRGADSPYGVIKRILRLKGAQKEEAAAIIRGKETCGTGIRAAVAIRYMKQRYKNAEPERACRVRRLQR